MADATAGPGFSKDRKAPVRRFGKSEVTIYGGDTARALLAAVARRSIASNCRQYCLCLFKATINYSRCSKRRYHLAIRQISGVHSQRVAGLRGHPRVIFHATYRRPYNPSHSREMSSARSPDPAHRVANLTKRRFLSQRWNYKLTDWAKKMPTRQIISNYLDYQRDRWDRAFHCDALLERGGDARGMHREGTDWHRAVWGARRNPRCRQRQQR